MEDYKKYWHPKFKLVVDLIHILYELDGCGSGGCCHIVTDDDNIYDDDLDFVIEFCEREENKDRIDRELSSVICKILKQMSFEQRAVLFHYMNCDIDEILGDEKLFCDIIELRGDNIENIIEMFDHRRGEEII